MILPSSNLKQTKKHKKPRNFQRLSLLKKSKKANKTRFLMENDHHLPHLLVPLLLAVTMLPTTNPQPTAPSPAPSSSVPPPPPPPTPPPPTPLDQLNNIIDALIGAGDFSSWVAILSMANPTVLPLSATLFIPQDNTFLPNHDSHPPLDPFLFPYHVVPQRLTFSDLLLLPTAVRPPTLLPGKTISVTDNTAGNFSLDDTPLTDPDLYSTPSVAVHGVAGFLDYSVFGNGIPPPPPPEEEETLPPPIGWKSGAGGARSFWCTGVCVVFLISCWWRCFLL